MKDKHDLLGTILEIQRMSTEDGPGLRTTVFFKGCPLCCAWCHNPESISSKPQLHWVGSRCIGCGTCVETCPNQALSSGPTGINIDRNLCQSCGECAEACPSTALEMLGKPWTVDKLAHEVAKDRAYFQQSGGGVTASGGEATMQAAFVATFFQACRLAGISTALDTCGHCSRGALEAILPFTDLVLFDLKLMDPVRHQAYTGVTNEIVKNNLLFVRDWIRSHLPRRELWVRTPIIPGATDHPEDINALGKFLAKHLKSTLTRWDLVAFNNLCRDKYLRLGQLWDYRDTPLMTAAAMESLAWEAKGSGLDPDLVHWSGPTRLVA